MTREELIDKMDDARKIHLDWAAYQNYLVATGQEIVPNVGNAAWHVEWVRIYVEVIKELKKNVS